MVPEPVDEVPEPANRGIDGGIAAVEPEPAGLGDRQIEQAVQRRLVLGEHDLVPARRSSG